MTTRNERSLNAVLLPAGLAGLIVLVILWLIFGAGFWGALLWGVIVAVAVALVLLYRRGEPRSGGQEAAAPSSAERAAAPAAEPSQAAPGAAPAEKPAPPAPASQATAATPASADAPKAAPPSPAPEPTSAPPAPAREPTSAAPAPAAEDKAAPPAPAKPAFLSAPREGGPDDLKLIKGIGPKLEKMLNEMGVYHFDQIAAWTEAEVAWVDENLPGFKGRVSRDNWVEQAKILAEGGTTEFAARVKKGDVH
ncbi:NADH-quinone oxidoreductase subunit E [Meinhardsimonia xiamenensis]|jgi:predicted flap endonuclease-1-like 5' DNA nuclease|uniref:NADH-quinone oxidoreductase subunit E n=1 Tax=Meinhardsimonia xiamenensis TaxID=990712 RepID=A0A1G9G370_9RHOB|nr:NADH:quinone oxidoreductase [Meinhardsimonia xiamenensis]PRX32699.1 putative flap endonuclease-1-like 5' DNA nuclease [Meinhardsimonia xiamenensis]SDK95109.1 NADH-quinone oxidoreductase subunit E [Meinhardsimonia xiamenensis]